MAEPLVHYYNVIAGKCPCGEIPQNGAKTVSVFPQNVTCPKCLSLLNSHSGKPEGK
ncbi:MAG TPA: hypothetical protein VK633_05075 [Verrucomicrobiae bacterium]|nr:hypothetical protein [Verrucomicrobiae bacterium]